MSAEPLNRRKSPGSILQMGMVLPSNPALKRMFAIAIVKDGVRSPKLQAWRSKSFDVGIESLITNQKRGNVRATERRRSDRVAARVIMG